MTKNNTLPDLQFVINHLIEAYNNYVIENKPFDYCLIIYFNGETNILGDTEFNDFCSIESYDTDVFESIYENYFNGSDVKVYEYLNAKVLSYISSYGYKPPLMKVTDSVNSCDLYLSLRAKTKFTTYNHYIDFHGYGFFNSDEIIFNYFLSDFNPYIVRDLIKHKDLSNNVALICYVLICNMFDDNISIGEIDWSDLKYGEYIELIGDFDDFKKHTLVKKKYLEFNNTFA